MGVILFTLPLLGDISLQTALGVAGTIASFLMAKPPKPPTIKAMSSAWGDTWPIVYNSFRLPGKCIQAGDAEKHNVKSKKGGPTYSLTFGMGVCEGVRSIGRIWADSQVIYDPRPIGALANWQANHLYGVGDQIQIPGHTNYILTATNNGESGSSEPSWNFALDGATRDNEIVWLAAPYKARTSVGQQYNFTMRIYDGSETQLPDSALEEQVGTGNQVAYRGLTYVVFENFDLSRYGNRIPNLEFEVLGSDAEHFVQGAVLYGAAVGGNTTYPFTTDDSGNLYNVNGGPDVVNSKTLAFQNLTTSRINTDALGLGVDSVSGASWTLLPLGGTKYFIAVTRRSLSPTPNYNVVLYETNVDGTVTAIGAQSYFSALISVYGPATIRSDTGEVMFVWGDFANDGVNLFVCDSIANLQHPWSLHGELTRSVGVAEINSGEYGFSPGPYVQPYPLGWVGNDLYVALNKTCMDWITTHSPGDVGYNTYYASLQPSHPTGVLLKINTLSDGAGALTYIYFGVVTEYGWPFDDEGLKKSGAVGNTTSSLLNYDSYSGPVESQLADGTVTNVFFARAYSDADSKNEVGVRQFQSGVQVGEIQGAPFDGAYAGAVSMPKAAFVSDAIYLTFSGSGGLNYAKLGNFAPASVTLADIAADVSARVGLVPAQLDYSGLVPVVPTGAALLQRDSARSFLEAMQPAYFYDITDIGRQLVGSLRSHDSLVQVIPEDDLAASPGETNTQGTIVDKISTLRNDDLEIPEDLSISYYDYQHDYQQGSQQARRGRVTQYSSGKNSVSVPVVMTPWDANTAAQRGLFLMWVERSQRKITLPPKYMARTPVDVIQVTRNNRLSTIRLTKVTLKPDSWVLDVESVSEDLGTYAITGRVPIASLTTGSFDPGTINPPSTPVLTVIDTATLRQSDLASPGTYLASANSDGGVFDTVFAQESVDNSTFDTISNLTVSATMGTVPLALGAPAHYALYDTVNSLTVRMYNGALASADKWQLSDLTTNLAWLSNGEIIQFATATLNSDETYTLSGLRRGRYGTEAFVATHGINETFVMLDETMMQNDTYAASEIGATRYWRGLNDAPINPSSAAQTLVMTTRRLMPFAPSFIRGSRDGSHNLTVTGRRRTRWHGQPLWHPPETDSPAAVEIDIYNGLTVVRTLTATLSGNGSGVTDADTFSAYYAAADQVIDFGSAQSSVSLTAYARNATVGRGYGGARAV